jgi:hypothetical protein
MSSKLRRFEVLLPVRFNDGGDIPEALLGEAVNEIVLQFSSVSFRRDAIEGQWQHEGVLFRDNLACVVVDVPDIPNNRKWMKASRCAGKNAFNRSISG